MEIFARDWFFGEFQASSFGLIPASFEAQGYLEEDTNISVETTEEFLSDNPVPTYIGQKYSDKLRPVVTLTKDPCATEEIFLTEYECRAILRLTTGQNGYQWMRLVTEEVGEDLWYRARITNVAYNKIQGKVAGIKFTMECDSIFAWSAENTITIDAVADTPFYIYSNSDDLHNYTYPEVTALFSSAGNWELVNTSDNNWSTQIKNIVASEQLTIDNKREILLTSRNESGQAVVNILDNMNLHWIRLCPGENEFISNMDATMTFKFRVPRKVAFVNF